MSKKDGLKPGEPAPRVTNEIPVALAPDLTLPANVVTVTADTLTFNVTVSPKVWRPQRLALIVGTREIAGSEFTEDKRGNLTFQCPRAAVGRRAAGGGPAGPEAGRAGRPRRAPAGRGTRRAGWRVSSWRRLRKGPTDVRVDQAQAGAGVR